MAVLPPDPVFVLHSPDMGPVNSLCFYYNENLLAGTAKGTIHLWDLQTIRPSLSFDTNDGSRPITSMNYSKFDDLVNQEKGGIVKCWQLNHSKFILKSELDLNHIGYCRTDIINCTNILIAPSNNNDICLIPLNDFVVQQRLSIGSLKSLDNNKNLGHITSLKGLGSVNTNYIIAGYESGDIITWDMRQLKSVNHINFDVINNFVEEDNIFIPMTIDYDLTSNLGIYGGSNDRVIVFSYNFRTMAVNKKNEIYIRSPGINCLKIRNDQKIFTTAGWDGKIRVFSLKTFRPLAVLTEHKSGGVMDICYSNEELSLWKARIMAVGGTDGQISLWDLYN